MRISSYLALSASLLLAATPALSSSPVPAPILGAGLPGLALLGVIGGGYAVLRWRRGRK